MATRVRAHWSNSKTPWPICQCVNMTHPEEASRLRLAVKEVVKRSSLRKVAKQVGVSHTTLASFLADADETSDRTLQLIWDWLDYRRAEVAPDLEARARRIAADRLEAVVNELRVEADQLTTSAAATDEEKRRSVIAAGQAVHELREEERHRQQQEQKNRRRVAGE